MGIVTDSYIYDAFGRTIGQTGITPNMYLFAGEQRDRAIGLDYLRARYMNSSLGRFASRDTFPGMTKFPVSLHRFIYASDNPAMFRDPSGLFSIVQVTVNVTINATLTDVQKSFAKAGLIAVAKTFAIRETILDPAYTVQQLALKMISNGLPGGESLYAASRLMIAQGYEAVGVSLQGIYESTADSIFDFELALKLNAIDQFFNDIELIANTIAKFVALLSIAADDGFSDLARIEAITSLGDAIIDRL